MNSLSVVNLALALVAAWAAGLNFWTFVQRPEDRGHLWLGIAGLGVALMGIPTALLYQSTSAETATWLRMAMGIASLPFFLGFLRFSEIFLRRSLRRAERIAIPAIVGSGLALSIPSAGFTGEPVVRRVDGFGILFIDTSTGPLVALVSLGFLALALYLISHYLRALPDDPKERAPILGAVGLFAVVMLNDVGVALDLLESPFLTIVGYGGLVIAFTAVLSKRYVASVARVEESADLLQHAAIERTEALRQRDLQLAHGEALATVGTLAAGLAHEINNPIAFVSANLNHLEDLRTEPDSEAEFVEVLEETREGVERIRSIVGELLRLARRQEGGTEEVDLGQVVESVLPIVRHEARGRASLEMQLEPVPPVLGDRRLLGQVVVNLVLNAIHAIPEEHGPGEVIIATRADPPIVKLQVRDTGSGIPADAAAHIFLPFYTTKASGEGTGLGLAITHQLVTQHHGRIRFDTSAAGTTMTVELPMAGSAPLTDEAATGPAHRG